MAWDATLGWRVDVSSLLERGCGTCLRRVRGEPGAPRHPGSTIDGDTAGRVGYVPAAMGSSSDKAWVAFSVGVCHTTFADYWKLHPYFNRLLRRRSTCPTRKIPAPRNRNHERLGAPAARAKSPAGLGDDVWEDLPLLPENAAEPVGSNGSRKGRRGSRRTRMLSRRLSPGVVSSSCC